MTNVATYDPSAPRYYVREFDAVCRAIEAGDGLVSIEGAWYIRPTVAAALVDHYWKLVQVGYANGWLA